MDDEPRINLRDLRAALEGRLESLAESLLGARNRSRSTSSQWRFGKQGSLSLELRGRKRGAWHSYEGGEGGGPIELIAHGRNIPFADAIQWGAKFAGIAPTTEGDRFDDARNSAERAAKASRRREVDAADAAVDRQHRLAQAKRVWGQTVAPAETIAAHYLGHTRGIPIDIWPDGLRFLPVGTVTLREQAPDGQDTNRTLRTAGALVMAATAPDGTVQAIQRIYLDDTGDNLRRADGGKIKLTLGAPSGAAARLPGPADGPLLIAEGPETGLSVWCATRHETWVTMGSLSTIELPLGRRIVVCRDDDKPHSPADRALTRALARWRGAGINVVVAAPWPARRGDKSDFNDAIRDCGIEAVQTRVASALHPHGRPPVRVGIAEGRRLLGGAVAAFFAVAGAWHAEQAVACSSGF